LRVEVHGADGQDRDGAKGLPLGSRRLYPFVERVFADGAYAGQPVEWAKDKANLTLEIVRRMPWAEGFVVLRRRWVVERTFAWIVKCRRLVRDDEQLPAVAETLILIAASAVLLRRWP
jgi:transposase